MPFDFPSHPDELTFPKTLESLSFILRNRQFWPRGFEWNYMRCGSCALGLARDLWWSHRPNGDNVYAVASELSADEESMNPIFTGLAIKLNKQMIQITPEHVADAIDAYLKEHI